MRLNDFTSIDELVDLGLTEFIKRSNAPSFTWMPSRQNVYTSQCNKYADMLLKIVDNASKNDFINSKMNPSQFVKSAQDFQLAARKAGMEKKIVLEKFLSLANVGMMLKRYYYSIYLDKVKNVKFSNEKEFISKADQLNGLLRAYSEALYFDDHTVSGEFYGNIEKNGKVVVVRSYSRLCPNDFLDCFNDFIIQKIDSYSLYEDNCLDFDCLGNIKYKNQKRPVLCGFYVECLLINGERVIINNTKELNALINKLELQFNKILNMFFSISDYSKKCLLLRSAYYAFKPILNIIDYEWEPTKCDIELYINSLQYKPEFDIVSEKFKDLTETSKARKIVDPRFDL